MNVFSIVGARPQFIKASPLSQQLREFHNEYLVHTGQHYDDTMSRIFFNELGIPKPDVNLGVGSHSHACQTAEMMKRLDALMMERQPDIVLVYGDTNSTLAGALVAAKLHIPIAHVEAGLRSYNRTMPEEINRVLTDHVSRWLFCPTDLAAQNLAKEGILNGVLVTGDIMVDAVLLNIERARKVSDIHAQLHQENYSPYALATIHRPENADSRENLSEIMRGLAELGMPVYFPVHPRTRRLLNALNWPQKSSVVLLEPLGYLDLLALLDRAAVAITDSGGLQKEAYVLQTPCVTVRSETEWVETVTIGWNRLVSPQWNEIQRASTLAVTCKPETHPDVYGDGKAALRIVNALGN